MKNYFDLKGQVALVTGCSTGLGVQMAKALANQGANIVVVARRQNLIEEVAKEIKEEFNVETLPVVCDITDTEAVESLVDKTLEKFGRIDILVNNAGTGAVAPAEDNPDAPLAAAAATDPIPTVRKQPAAHPPTVRAAQIAAQ